MILGMNCSYFTWPFGSIFASLKSSSTAMNPRNRLVVLWGDMVSNLLCLESLGSSEYRQEVRDHFKHTRGPLGCILRQLGFLPELG